MAEGLARLGGWLGREGPVARPRWCLRGGEGAAQRHRSAGAGDSPQHSLRVPFCFVVPAFPIQVIVFLLVFKSLKVAFNLCLHLLPVFLVEKFIIMYRLDFCVVPLWSLEEEEERWSLLALYSSVVVGLFLHCCYLLALSLA